MSENLYANKKQSSVERWIYIFVLFLSFVWINLYPATNSLTGSFYGNYGNLLDFSNPNLSFFIAMIVTQSAINLISFEFIFWLYRGFLSMRVYSFVVPKTAIMDKSRLFFALRNLIYGIFINLCYFFPFLYVYCELIDIVVTLAIVISYASHLNKQYSEPLIGHFVFENFCYPIFVYEALVLFFQLVVI